jgi:hypothetical protein
MGIGQQCITKGGLLTSTWLVGSLGTYPPLVMVLFKTPGGPSLPTHLDFLGQNSLRNPFASHFLYYPPKKKFSGCARQMGGPPGPGCPSTHPLTGPKKKEEEEEEEACP